MDRVPNLGVTAGIRKRSTNFAKRSGSSEGAGGAAAKAPVHNKKYLRVMTKGTFRFQKRSEAPPVNGRTPRPIYSTVKSSGLKKPAA